MADLEIEEAELDLSKLEVNAATGEVRQRPEGLFATPETTGHKYSVSLLKDFADCGAKAYARITKQPSTRGIALVNGIAVHAALEKFLVERSDPQQIYKEEFARVAEENKLPRVTDEATSAQADGKVMLTTAVDWMENDKDFLRLVQPELVERQFVFERNGRLYVGRFDLLYVRDDEEYSVMDFKSGRNSPSQTALDTDWQFTIYDYAASHAEGLSTKGKWPVGNVWWHLRGKLITKAAPTRHRKEVRQFFFPTVRTPEFVEKEFTETIEPLAERMERGDFIRIRGAHCSWCPYWNSAKEDCGVDMPTRAKIHNGEDINTTPDLSKGLTVVS